MPLPWWTSQSRTRTRSTPHSASAWAAATATLLKRQKPIARSRSAWWPGRAQAAEGEAARPPSSRSAACTAPPAACRAASKEPALATVSTSIMPPPRAQNASIASTWAARVDPLELLAGRGRRLDAAPARASPRVRARLLDRA